MPTLERLTRMLEFGLTAFPGTPPGVLTRTITSVLPVHPGDRHQARGNLTQTLAIVDLDDWASTDPAFDRLVSRTAGSGVAALAIVSTTGHAPAELVEALRHLHVPLLTLPASTSWADFTEAVTRERMADLHRGIEWRDWLLGQARPVPDGRHSGRIVRWLAARTGSRVALIGRDGALAAVAPQRSADKLTAVADKIQEIADGTLESAALEDGGTEIRLVAVGTSRPRAVLAVARESPFDHAFTRMIGRAADLLSLHLAVEDADTATDSYRATAIALCVAILQLLMVGEVSKARRTAASLFPGLLDQDAARVYILESRPGERDHLYDECQRSIGRHALIVQCPVYDEHLIIVVPQPPGAADADDRACTALRDLVALRPYRYLGASAIRPVAETDQAYRHALRALANARVDRSRTAHYRSQRRLPELLNEAYPGWATAVLHPLLGQRRAERDVLLQALNLTLQFSVRAAAELTGAHRNTVANRVRSAAAVLGVDLDSLRDRALTAVALEALLLDERADETVHVGPPDLQAYLDTPEVQAWKREFLHPLTEELVTTLKEWVLAGGDTARMADALGIHTQTARKRLRAATRLLQRDLLGQGADAYDVVLAIASEFNIPLPLPRWPDPH